MLPTSPDEKKKPNPKKTLDPKDEVCLRHLRGVCKGRCRRASRSSTSMRRTGEQPTEEKAEDDASTEEQA